MERESRVLLELQGYSSEQLLFLFTDRAPTTLKRHPSGWRRWAEYCFGCNVAMGAPACTRVLDLLEALAEGSQSNRGKRRSQAARGVLCFVAHKLGLQFFACTLHGPIVGAWLAAGKWDRKPFKEADGPDGPDPRTARMSRTCRPHTGHVARTARTCGPDGPDAARIMASARVDMFTLAKRGGLDGCRLKKC